MQKASIIADREFIIDELDRRVFGSFVEHLGRCIYGGIYEPGHATADEHGFRGDVLALTRELGVSVMRYPGGNFVSGYNWRDGVGPKEQRPVRLDLAWFSTETNQFGTNEFIIWCRKAGIEPMMAVNLGTAGPDEARQLVEYCNHAGGTEYSDLRIAHGYPEPHDIKFWCLGNEMDGPWQICHKTAEEYARTALEAAKVMRWTSQGLTLAACGSSSREMATYGAWEYEVLDHCFEAVDFISLHQYFLNREDDIARFFTHLDKLDNFITGVAAIADAVAAKRRSRKRIMLSMDEWNVWYKARSPVDVAKPGWPQAPKLLEEIYNFEDALVVGGALITLINHADRVKTACLAQLVNVIGAIMTETGGPAWRQTIFHPFAQASRLARGNVLRLVTNCGTFAAGEIDNAPLLLATAVHDPASGAVSVFALNRSRESMSLSADLRGFGSLVIAESFELKHADLKATNTRQSPDEVTPVKHPACEVSASGLEATLKPLSWNVFALKAG
ncbi:MAG: alpha-N-arabinofuranosidase [Steroidobacteraceae bacterium]